MTDTKTDPQLTRDGSTPPPTPKPRARKQTKSERAARSLVSSDHAFGSPSPSTERGPGGEAYPTPESASGTSFLASEESTSFSARRRGTEGEVLFAFHPAVRTWFTRHFKAPTDAQAAGWPIIQTGRDVLIAAPTGSGKTLAAFLAGIDSLIRQAEAGSLSNTTQVVYVSPLKALGNDIQRNLEAPLAQITEVAQELGYDLPAIRTAVRTGDTPMKDRQAFIKTPPHILITTPESLYLMLTAARARETLRHVRTVIVDEIHALARDKRGSHLSLTLARLDHVANTRPSRIGLSATQKPVEEIAAFLGGVTGNKEHVTSDSDSESGPATRSLLPVAGGERGVVVVDLGHQRDIELHIEVPPSDLEAVTPKEQWTDVYDRLAGLIRAHRTTLVFVNTRRLSERVAHNLKERLGEEAVASHHGSMARDRRLKVEQRLKAGELKALVCTASLELGIDIGSIDLVCQIGSPRSVATFLQRVGRSGHALGLRPQGRLFPTSRDELLECAALVRAVKAGRLDRIVQPVAPLDILAQQIVAECACEDWPEKDLLALFRRAYPYRNLSNDDFEDVVEMLAEGAGDAPGRAPPLIHRDRINGVLHARRGTRMTAILNGGAIPEMADYRVIADPDDAVVGTVGEDWAIESMQGDIFLLGSHSWRIKRVAAGEVRVEDAHGAPPTIPFWVGEAPGRTAELSQEVGRLRRDVVEGLDDVETLTVQLKRETGLNDLGAVQIIEYLAATRDVLGLVPSDTDVVFERFFDESGGMQLVVHAPFGARINKAWGLTLRKRFCVRFDFELQAAASDDSIVLSLGPQHSFPLEESFQYVTSRNAESSLRQAVLYAPVFPIRWRWDAGRALAVPRYSGARKVPPPIQRMRADDLLAAVFPAQVGCQENATGPLEIPDHPLVRQTVNDCMHEAMDLDGLVDVLQRIEAGSIRLHARDTLEPSPMAHEILNGKPYTYLDDAPLEERRTRAITLRRALPENARELGALDMDAIERVREEAWPVPRDLEEAHEALLSLVVLPLADADNWQPYVDQLIEAGRAATFELPADAYRSSSDVSAQSASMPANERTDPPSPSTERGPGGEVSPERASNSPVLTTHDSTSPSPLTERRPGDEASPERASNSPVLTMSDSASPSPSTERRPGGEVFYFALENLRLIEALFAHGTFERSGDVPEHALVRIEDRDDARRRLIRGWTEAIGPTSAFSLANRLGMAETDVEFGIRQVEGMGFVLRGRFTPGVDRDEWCDRRLLARIHRYTLDRLRREIDPVPAQDYMRFLLGWQHLSPESRLAGKAGVRQAINRLQGYEAAASAWERELLVTRISDYRSSWLDELCLGGEVVWARLTPRKSERTAGATPTRATPITLALRPSFPTLVTAVRGESDPPSGPRTGAAAEILALLRQRGALFFDEIVNGTRRLRSDVERGLRELVAWGLVTADGFQGLRQLLGKAPHQGRSRMGGASGYSAAGFFAGGGPAGRWSLVRWDSPAAEPVEAARLPEPVHPGARGAKARLLAAAAAAPSTDVSALDTEELAESTANVLLQRYGVLFRDLYARESLALPWRDVLRALRRLEARGLVRGGRFVSGFNGEQYALPEAVDALRRVRRTEKTGERVWVNASDPANLSGVVVPGPKLPAISGKGLLYVDGLPQDEEESRSRVPVPSKLMPKLSKSR